MMLPLQAVWPFWILGMLVNTSNMVRALSLRTGGPPSSTATSAPLTTSAAWIPQPPSTQVKFHVQRLLPNLATPAQARRVWLEYVWEQGGGLPFLMVVPRKTADESPSIVTTSALETTLLRRQLLPVGLEEKLLLDETDGDDSSYCQIKYQVVKAGLLSTEIIPESHLGVVVFESNGKGGVQLIWEVMFNTTSASRTFLWQAVTKRTISDTCNNLVAMLATPKVYTRRTILRYGKDRRNQEPIAPRQMMEAWVEFCWKQGGGLPLPIPPIRTGDSDEVRWIVPPFLKERLISVNMIDDKDEAEIQYQVDNPSLVTYQVHSHRGRVLFSSTNDDSNIENQTRAVVMKWEVEIRPYHGWSSVVQAFTGAVVSSYARNFKCHVQEGSDAKVALKPPRGSTGKTLLQIRKDSWLGGVLDAHLRDNRSTAQQTTAVFQPWTWGRNQGFDEEYEGEEWQDGVLSN